MVFILRCSNCFFRNCFLLKLFEPGIGVVFSFNLICFIRSFIISLSVFYLKPVNRMLCMKLVYLQKLGQVWFLPSSKAKNKERNKKHIHIVWDYSCPFFLNWPVYMRGPISTQYNKYRRLRPVRQLLYVNGVQLKLYDLGITQFRIMRWSVYYSTLLKVRQ